MYGCAVDFAIHAPHRDGDRRNHHGHVLATTRTIEATGLGEKTEIEWSDPNRLKAGLRNGKDEISEIRDARATFTNQKLKELKLEAQVDHRTLNAQGIHREPTVRLGPSVSSMERRGVRTDVGYRVQQEASARLEREAELASVRSESRDVARSILSLATRISAALAAGDTHKGARQDREREVAKDVQRGKALTPDEVQEVAQGKWLKYCEQ